MDIYRRFIPAGGPGALLPILFAAALAAAGLQPASTLAAPKIPCELLDTCLEDELLGLGGGGLLGQVERFLTAGQLEALCLGGAVEQSACRLYIAGVHDTAELAYWQNQIRPPWCPAGGLPASRLQGLFLDYMAAAPEETGLPAAYAVSRAMTYGLTCEER